MKAIGLYIKENIQYVVLTISVWVVLLIISPDSYIHYPYTQLDSACFFTAGKAMMNGMTPYVDFADSKGPLLWLIYGIGYIISHHNYIGVFWLSWISFSVFFFYLYKIALLYLDNKQLSLLSTILMFVFVFYFAIHAEVGAENWCQPFITATLYYTCRIIHFNHVTIKDIRKTFIVLGVSFSSCLLIKYNGAALFVSFFLVLFFFLLTNKPKMVLSSIGWTLIGVLFVLLPFLIWLLSIGALEAFVDEYFINTLLTVNGRSASGFVNYYWDFRNFIFNPLFFIYFLLSLLGCIGIKYLTHKSQTFLLFIVLSFYGLSLWHAFPHYYEFCAPLSIFFVICTVHLLRKILLMNFRQSFLVVFLCVFLLTLEMNITGKQRIYTGIFKIDESFVFRRNDIAQSLFYERQKVYDIVSKVNKPKIIYYKTLDNGEGLMSEALPGSKYWITQTGATNSMLKRQIKDIKARNADFIITPGGNNSVNKDNISFLRSCGYFEVFRYGDGFTESERVIMKRDN